MNIEGSSVTKEVRYHINANGLVISCNSIAYVKNEGDDIGSSLILMENGNYKGTLFLKQGRLEAKFYNKNINTKYYNVIKL